MTSYRIYLRSPSGAIQGRDDFEAEDDGAAMTIAELLHDACSDVSDTFELWNGAVWVDKSFSKMPCPPVSADQITLAMQEALRRREEAIRNSGWAIARSKRLLERLSHLEAKKNS